MVVTVTRGCIELDEGDYGSYTLHYALDEACHVAEMLTNQPGTYTHGRLEVDIDETTVTLCIWGSEDEYPFDEIHYREVTVSRQMAADFADKLTGFRYPSPPEGTGRLIKPKWPTPRRWG